jgi:hypothetical protein
MLQTPNKHTKALLDLADYFEQLDPSDYDQTNYEGCICGHCNHRAGRTECDSRARVELGLTHQQAARLFSSRGGFRTGPGLFGAVFSIPPTPQDAARCLRHIAVTGEVPKDW